MISHSKAYERVKQQSQRHLDFVILVCSAIPQFALGIATGALTDANAVPPDHFKGVSVLRLAASTASYQQQLASASVVTLFSYFESYVRDVLGEIVAFHGGEGPFVSTADRRTRAFLSRPPASIVAAKRKLQEPAKSGLTQKYRKYTNDLKAAGFRFPSELMAATGVRIMVKKASSGFRAFEITEILSDVLHVPLTATDKAQLETVRALRNRVAHGNAPAVSIADAMVLSRQLHRITQKVDQHVVEHFFILEAYA